MRHGNKNNNLSRTASHRAALLKNMAGSLILHKRIVTTLAKAKVLRKYVEPLITKSKNDTTHSRRVVFSYLQSKEAIKELFGPISEKIATRPGGYTRILKLGFRAGDAAEMAMIELVDFNEFIDATSTKKKATRRRKPGTTAKKTVAPVAEVAPVQEVVAPEVIADAIEETAGPELITEVQETTAEVSTVEPTASAEEKTDDAPSKAEEENPQV